MVDQGRTDRHSSRDGGAVLTSATELPELATEATHVAEHHNDSALCVLVVEDDPPVREACVAIAGSMGFITATAESIPGAREALGQPLDIVLLDLKLPGGDGISLLSEIRQRHPSAIVIVMTALATVKVEALRVGASDYLPKPFTLEELTEALERASLRRSFDAESRRLRERLRTGRGEGALIGQSAGMEKLYRIVSKVATTSHPVLILGEAGTGKGVVAEAIHLNGPRSTEPFATVDCAAAVSSIDSALFGSEANGFHTQGLLATHGTVFLDEIAELPLELQSKLLRAVQSRTVSSTGTSEGSPLTARILSSSSRDLHSLVEKGRFRRDLFFRLNVMNLRVPPLRERKPDLPMLAAHILAQLREEKGQPYTFAEQAMRALMAYDWPGNVRELEHAIARACALSSGPILHLGDLPTQLQNGRAAIDSPVADIEAAAMRFTAAPALSPHAASAVVPIAEIEKQVILRTLRQLNGDKLMAARLLGIGKTTLYRKLKEYELSDDEI